MSSLFQNSCSFVKIWDGSDPSQANLLTVYQVIKSQEVSHKASLHSDLKEYKVKGLDGK